MNTSSSKHLISILLLAFFSVFSHWNFWSYDIYAIGFNTTLAWLGLIALFSWYDNTFSLKENILWLVPLLLIIISFSLYENPWLKTISILILPVAVCVFFSQSKFENNDSFLWNYPFIFKLCRQTCRPLFCIASSVFDFQQQTQTSLHIQNKHIFKQVFLGVAILIPLAAFALILLSSADANFSHIIENSFLKIFQNFNISFIFKIVFTAILSVLILSAFIAWSKPWTFSQTKKSSDINAITAIIIMSGLLCIYLLFLALQIEYLFINSLPIEFDQAEHLVKSGFWQLFFLSFLNIVLFTFFYKKTSTLAQYFVAAFIAASGFLLLSAAWRMGLYVFNYGFSYEKFFASYTCLFALGLFCVLVFFSITKQQKNLLKLILFSALWCYAIASIMPVEKIIFHTNIHLAKDVESRINLQHLKDLSIDILNNIENLNTPETQTSKAIDGFDNRQFNPSQQWTNWFKHNQSKSCQRPLFEKNISAFINCSNDD